MNINPLLKKVQESNEAEYSSWNSGKRCRYRSKKIVLKVIRQKADLLYEFPFIGLITSEIASGAVIKPSVSPTYISVVNPQVTFTYEYLW